LHGSKPILRLLSAIHNWEQSANKNSTIEPHFSSALGKMFVHAGSWATQNALSGVAEAGIAVIQASDESDRKLSWLRPSGSSGPSEAKKGIPGRSGALARSNVQEVVDGIQSKAA